jgi:hypothetical protein
MPFTISNPQRIDKNSLVGCADVETPSGLKFRRVMLHRKGDKHWFQFQSQEYFAGEEKRFAQIIEFVSPEARERFSEQLLPGLMRVLGEMGS